MLENYRDIMNLTYAFFEISGEIMMLAKVAVILVHWKISTVLLKQIQMDFNRSKSLFLCKLISIDDEMGEGREMGLQHHFAAADRESNLVARVNNVLIILAAIAHTGAPFAIVAINYCLGTLTQEMLVHPFKGV